MNNIKITDTVKFHFKVLLNLLNTIASKHQETTNRMIIPIGARPVNVIFMNVFHLDMKGF